MVKTSLLCFALAALDFLQGQKELWPDSFPRQKLADVIGIPTTVVIVVLVCLWISVVIEQCNFHMVVTVAELVLAYVLAAQENALAGRDDSVASLVPA